MKTSFKRISSCTIVSMMFLLVSCTKSEDTATTRKAVKEYKLSEVIRISASGTDTTKITYNGNEVIQTTRYSNNTSVYTTTYTKGNGFYNSSVTVNNQPSFSSYMRVRANGFVDSVHSRRADKTINNISSYYYDNAGYCTRMISNYITYENDYNMYYENGNYKYWINHFRNFTTPSQNRQDSIVFEFTAIPDEVSYKTGMADRFGKAPKNLVQKRGYYNRLTRLLYQTWEYQYKINKAGLVSEEIWNIYDQPAARLIRTDTSRMKYID
ncbi:hypothetical protein U0035_18965 [Niabella yanshanensis]|uniref:DUF4595 domain-containing protein n=1 Tax=Niabella yanshanensis TaxID=577386 RepID=A0ABZ0W5G5_9BACT|nr:hypothetical protein [Niabella yanshanensis]WQD37752.1 hypothetical protein U0035_18965 [Niabella yanshanensis]